MPLDSWISGFLAFWTSVFLVTWLCWFYLALAGSAFSAFLFAKIDIVHSFRIDITVIVAVYLDKRELFTQRLLLLLPVYPLCRINPIAICLQCQCSRNLARVLLFILLHHALSTDIAEMQGKSDAHYWAIRAQRIGSQKTSLNSFHKNFSSIKSTPYNLKNLFLNLYSLCFPL